MQFVRRLAENGCDVHVITSSRAPSSPMMTVHTLPIQRPTRHAQMIQFMRQAADTIGSGKYDIVHSMLPITGCDVYQPRGGTVAESVERNLALIRSGPLRAIKRQANRLNLKQRAQLRQEATLFTRHPGTIVAAVSRYVVDQLRRHYRMDDARIRLVFNGADVPDVTDEQRKTNRRQLREQFGLEPDDLVLLLVAHNFKLKGVAPAIEAIARLKRRDALPPRLLIVGRDHPGRFAHLAMRFGVGDRVTFVGPSDRVHAFYHASDVLLHPTYYDPCSRVVLEAMACGLPPITTRHNGAADVIEDGRNGYVVDSADAVDQLADRIQRLTDETHRRECGQRGRLLRERLSMARHVEEMLVVYEDILQRRRRV
ncbi:MAG: glycosyltransferase family 4 protein [Phycisphaerae bacterium]|nr:glycosyltransferase family 4 protein [Phycisphaerae bacterium]